MKIIGYILITGGFLAGSLVVVLDETAINWSYYSIAFAMGILGIFCVRFSDSQKKRSGNILETNVKSLESSLTSIVKNITKLNQEKTSIDTYDLHQHIDELFAEDLTTFVDNRKALAYTYGMQTYADIMSCFAAAERYLNRVWSASTDGYVDESHRYLERSQQQFLVALKQFHHLT